MFLDDRVGSIEVGKATRWRSGTRTVTAPAALKEMKAELTLLAGRIVHRGYAFPATKGERGSSEPSPAGPALVRPCPSRHRRRVIRRAADVGSPGDRVRLPGGSRRQPRPAVSAVAAPASADPMPGCRWCGWFDPAQLSHRADEVGVAGRRRSLRPPHRAGAGGAPPRLLRLHLPLRTTASTARCRTDPAARRAVARLRRRHGRRLELDVRRGLRHGAAGAAVEPDEAA